ncbi:MAG TPA: hypothetical protein VFR41_10845 [Acidimicrobiia bacterium]|nr:hypothetical protein [Acidimicrobiia bacterium]
MALRLAIAAALFAVLALVAWWLERRRRPDAPSQGAAVIPAQLDRAEFGEPDRPWLVALFTSRSCESCQGLYDRAAPLASNDVAVVEVEYFAQPDLHERYHIDAAPVTVVADADGIVRASIVGAFSAPELWDAVATVRAGYSP